jgi:hypothetical protein
MIGTDYYIVPWNEFDVIMNGWSEDEADSIALQEMKWWTNVLRDRGVKADKIIISTSRMAEMMSTWGYKMELHGVNSPRALDDAYIYSCEPIFPNGDGIDPNAEGRQGDVAYKREPSVAQAKEMKRLIGYWKSFGYLYFNRNVENGTPTNLRRAEFDVLKALVEG